MADKHLFWLDADRKWDLAYDRLQWMIRRRGSLHPKYKGAQEPSEGWQSEHFKFDPKWYVGDRKATLFRFISPRNEEPRIELTDEARLALGALPDDFRRWRYEQPAEAFYARLDRP